MSLAAPPANRPWTGAGGDSNWTTVGNWGAGVPTATNHLATFGPLPVNRAVTLDHEEQIYGLSFTDGGYTFDFAGNALTLGTADAALYQIDNQSTGTQTFNVGAGRLTLYLA